MVEKGSEKKSVDYLMMTFESHLKVEYCVPKMLQLLWKTHSREENVQDKSIMIFFVQGIF